MSKVSPFHSKLAGTQVYHDQTGCTVGDKIESYNRVSGMGGLGRCVICEAID
jgi:hypothetical protein